MISWTLFDKNSCRQINCQRVWYIVKKGQKNCKIKNKNFRSRCFPSWPRWDQFFFPSCLFDRKFNFSGLNIGQRQLCFTHFFVLQCPLLWMSERSAGKSPFFHWAMHSFQTIRGDLKTPTACKYTKKIAIIEYFLGNESNMYLTFNNKMRLTWFEGCYFIW